MRYVRNVVEKTKSRPLLKHFEMDLTKTLEEFRAEKEKLERAIALLEQLQAGIEPSVVAQRRRGRKAMSAEERREVSERMRKSWERRRPKGKSGLKSLTNCNESESEILPDSKLREQRRLTPISNR